MLPMVTLQEGVARGDMQRGGGSYTEDEEEAEGVVAPPLTLRVGQLAHAGAWRCQGAAGCDGRVCTSTKMGW